MQPHKHRDPQLMLEKIDHIGIAVHSIDQARKFYEEILGLPCEGMEEVPSQGVKTAFFAIGDTHIELLEPLDQNGPLARFLATRGEGIHHIAYASDDLPAQLRIAREKGCRLIHDQPIPGAGNKRIAFVHPKSSFGVLTEFCEKHTDQVRSDSSDQP